ncbi:MAG: sugar phosphate isomerase/epimerase [Clostridiaceae bacterium]|nr:sugar phosphate isomerase/epimerase [Clostridiaceae bacterium]
MAWIKSSGLDAVEIILSDPKLLPISDIQNHLLHLDLAVSTLSTGQAAGLEDLSLMSPSRDVRTRTVERLKEDIDLSVELGRPHVTIGLIRGKGGCLPFDDEYTLLCRSLAEVANYASKRSVVLNLEPINRYECLHLNESSAAIRCIEDIGNPENVGVLYDTFHSNIEDPDMISTIAMLSDKISHVHIADSNRRLPGEGHIDFHVLKEQLEKIDYAGYVSLEVLNVPSADHVVEHAAGKLFTFFR